MQSSNDSFSFDPYIPDAGFDLGLPVAPQLLPHLWLPTFSTDPSIFSFVDDTGPALPMPAPYPFPSPFPLPMPQTNPHVFPVDRFLPVVAPFTTNREVLLVEAAGSPSPQGQNLRSVAQTPTTPARKARVQRRRRMNSEQERIAFLKNDHDIEIFTKSRVTCLACGKLIKLDTRDGARFYVGAWVRHKECCKVIKKRNEAGCRQESTAADERRTNS